MAWLMWYVNVLSGERREKEALRRELAETRRWADRAEQRADRAEQRMDDVLTPMLTQMLALLEQIAANTTPREPGRPDQQTPEPDGESVSLGD